MSGNGLGVTGNVGAPTARVLNQVDGAEAVGVIHDGDIRVLLDELDEVGSAGDDEVGVRGEVDERG